MAGRLHRFTQWGRAFLVHALLVLALACPIKAAPPAEASVAALDPDDVLLFDARAAGLRLGDGIHGYRIGDGACVDLADFSRAVDLAITIDPARGIAQGWVFQESNLITINRAQGKALINSREQSFPADVVRDSKQGWCVGTEALARWFNLRISVDMLDSVLVVESDVPIPAVAAAQRAERAQVRTEVAQLQQRKVAGPPVETIQLPYKLWRPPSVDVTLGLSRNGSKIGGEYELFAAGEVAWLSAEGRLASDQRGKPQSLRLRLYRSDPDNGLFGRVRASEVAVGDISSLSTPLTARGVSGRGATITNRPLGQASQFDRTDFVGEAPVGWEVELYRNGELTGLTRIGKDGRFAFRDIPLLYGSNRLEIVKYGPQGQVRRERRYFEVGPSAVPPGRVYWWAHAVDENRDLLGFAAPQAGTSGWRFGMGLDYGLGLRTALAVSAHSLLRDGKRLRLVESELRRGFGPMAVALGNAVDTRGGHAHSINSIGRLGETNLSARYLRNHALFSEVIDRDLRDEAELAVDRPIKLQGMVLPLHFDLSRARYANGRRLLSASTRLSMTTRRFSATLTSALTSRAQPGAAYGPVDGNASLMLSGRVRGVTVRGEVNYRFGSSSGVADIRLSGEGALTHQDSWQGTIGFDCVQKSFSWSAGYTRHFKYFSLSSTLASGSGGAVSGRLGMLFSIGPDGRGRFGRITSTRIASTGSVAVNILRDGGESAGSANSAATQTSATGTTVNDAKDDGAGGTVTRLESAVRLRLGDQPANPETSGWVPGAPIVLAALAPAAPVLIGIDPSSLDDPLLNPAVRAVRVVPRKGLVLPLDLTVAATGIIDGRLRRADGSDAEGEALSLLNSSGHAFASTVTDFDGSFLFEKVPYGRYRLALGTAAGLVVLAEEAPPIVVNAAKPTHRLRGVMMPGSRPALASAQ
jgi:hypothetical protein